MSERISNWLMGLCIVAALALMGSDGDWFPLPNLCGAGILLVIAALIPRASAARSTSPAQLQSHFPHQSLRGTDFVRKER